MALGRFAGIIATTYLLLSLSSVNAQGSGGGGGPGRPSGPGQNPQGYGYPPSGPSGPQPNKPVQNPPGYGYPPSGPGGPGGYPGEPGQCVAYPHEIECVHITLELILRVAVSEYVSRNPNLRSQAPWFDAFTHVSIPPGSFTQTCLSLLSSIDIRESLTYCFENGGQHNRTYVPTSPVQMYKDLCTENAVIQEQILR